VFSPLHRVGQSGNHLTVQQSGVYEISYAATVSHEPGETVVALYVAKAGTTDPIPPTRADWWALGSAHIQAASKTALAYLTAGTQLALMLRAGQPGRLIVSPGATLVIRKIGD
jgi:hypothetical protein